MLTWRNILVILVLSLLSALAGSWVGTWQVREIIVPRSVLRGTVQEIANGSLALSPQQTKTIADIESRYQQRLQANRKNIGDHNREIATALFEERALGPKVDAALDKLQAALRSQEKEAVLYVLEVRKVLSPSQQVAFDKKVGEAWELSTP